MPVDTEPQTPDMLVETGSEDGSEAAFYDAMSDLSMSEDIVSGPEDDDVDEAPTGSASTTPATTSLPAVTSAAGGEAPVPRSVTRSGLRDVKPVNYKGMAAHDAAEWKESRDAEFAAHRDIGT
ncbi:hypothetical protein HK105_207354 [Polyrhizophydium stewartii]|uniref:Uncharacterized protein n=1 Tax=Polyrhizophydium stewartii TaxID=2732419 RepID=A0ABR4N0Q2_9FUNG